MRWAAEEMSVAAVPLDQRILDAVGTGAEWDTVADRLGVSPIDPDAAAVRNQKLPA
jgi:hypothetical protein